MPLLKYDARAARARLCRQRHDGQDEPLGIPQGFRWLGEYDVSQNILRSSTPAQSEGLQSSDLGRLGLYVEP